MARCSGLCQESELVPIVEPEVLMDGEHTLQRGGEVTMEILRPVSTQLYAQRVLVEGMLLKPNMVLSSLGCPPPESIEAGADATVKCFLSTASAAVRGDVIGVDRFGASAPGPIVMREYGFTVESVCQRAFALLESGA
ncbi:MAG: class I fructose-bisphosphate aldolase [Chthoniobacterales bacterium]